MFDTMYKANGVGLAAPQIGLDIRLFIVDATPFAEDEEYEEIADKLKDFKKVFINPTIIEERGEEWKFNEGCLSIPDVREDVKRKDTIIIEYFDENFVKHTEELSDLRARVVQHEYDHIQGILFTDHISNLKKKLVKGKIKKIEKDVIFSVEFFGIGESQSSRFVTSWATKEEDVDKLVELIKNLNVD